MAAEPPMHADWYNRATKRTSPTLALVSSLIACQPAAVPTMPPSPSPTPTEATATASAAATSSPASLPTALSGLTAAILDGRIHVIGGESADPRKVFREHEVFDLATGRWSTETPLDRGRHGLGSGVIRGRLYVAGGPNPDLAVSDRLDAFTP